MNKNFNPKVSIIIPVYNGSNYLKEAIGSALSQTYKNIEIVVVNDGSKDDGKTDKICRSYAGKIKYFIKENGGPATALNLGIEKMSGEYFSWLSHDDVYYPQKIERQIEFLSKIDKKEYIIPYANYELIDKGSKFLQEVTLDHEELIKKPEYALLRGSVNGITLLIPKKAFDRFGEFNPLLKCTQDYDMWRRISKEYTFIHMDEVLTKTRIHSLQDSNKHPNVLIEGDPLWIGMMKDISKQGKIKLEGSEYSFYREMAIFLRTTPYSGAFKFAQKQIEEITKGIIGKLDPIKVSVIIPFYNRIPLLLRAVESVRKQSYKNLEILLINDCSSDSLERIKELVAKDKRIKIVELEKNSGPGTARNRGIEEAKGEYIAFLDSDDEFVPEKIKEQLTQMYLSQYNVSHTSYIRKSPIRSVPVDVGLMTGKVIPMIVGSCQIATPTVMIKTEYLKKNKFRFKENIRIGEDTCFWLELLRNTKLLGINKAYTIVNVNENSAANHSRKQLEGLTNILSFILADKEFSKYHYEISNIMIRFLELSREITKEDYPHGRTYNNITFWARKPSNPILKFLYLIRYQGLMLTIKKILRKYVLMILNKIRK